MHSNNNVDILMIGHFAKDRLVVDGQGKEALGGAVYYGSVALHRLGVSVAVATRLHPQDFHFLEPLREEGIQVFAVAADETSGIENTYDSADMERRVCKPLGFAGPFQQQDIPDLQAQIYAFVPIIAGEVDLDLLKSISRQGPVALDIQGFVRVREGDQLVFREWPDMEEGLQHVTYLKVDRSEAELLTGETDMLQAVRRLRSFGPREIVLTQSSGVMVFTEEGVFRAPFTPQSLVGRTGRGDTCFATYLGKRLHSTPAEACRFAAAVTTKKQEHPGPWNGNMAEVESLLSCAFQ